MPGWVHANGELHIEDSTMLGATLTYNTNITLKNSLLAPGSKVEYSNLSSTRTHKFNENVTIKGILVRTNLVDIKNITIEGDLTDVTANNWVDVTIPSSKTFVDVKFLIPIWHGKNTWSPTVQTFTGVTVGKKYADNAASPTVEKLWYQTADINGAVTDTLIE